MPRTVVIAPDSFKGSLDAREVAAAIARGWHDVRPEDDLRLLPQADGGEGTLDAIESAVPGAVRHSAGPVAGPDGRPTPGEWLELPDGTAVVELAQCSGLPLMRELDPLGATTRGLGEVIRAALDSGATSLVIGLGGSASTDAATGALAALGLRVLDAAGDPLPDGGAALANASAIDRSHLVAAPARGVVLLTDVTAPLTGPIGAATVFGPQKGATPAQVRELDAALARFAALVGGDPAAPGAGAAGGAGYGFAALWGATIIPGADLIAELTGLHRALERADVLLTGEGKFDEQSGSGKVVGHVLGRAAAHGVKAGVIAGQVTTATDVWTASLTELAGSVEAALGEPAHWLRQAGAAAASAL
jgi:glycerate kinase